MTVEGRKKEDMAMRELVTGGAACAVPGSSSSSNPLGALANALVGSSSKTQVLSLYLLNLNLTFVTRIVFSDTLILLIHEFAVA